MGSILDSVDDISKLLAAYEANKAKGNLAQAGAQQNQANAAANIYRTQADVALKGPTQSAKSAALGDQMANIQPFQWTGDTAMTGNIPLPQFTGGLSPANFGPATRKAGADLATLSANRVSDPAFNIPEPPKLAPLPEASGLDSVLSTAGLLGQLAKAAANSGSGGDIKKLIDSILNRNKGGVQGNKPQPGGGVNPSNPFDNSFTGWDNGNTGQPTGEFGDWLNEPGTTPSVSTSTEFNGIPGGYPNNPEDPNSIDPNWWEQFVGNNGGPGDAAQSDSDGWGLW